jgi:hypothetical protein
MDYMNLSSPLRKGKAPRSQDVKSIVKRMLTTIRNRVAYHPDQTLETRQQLPSPEGLVGMSSQDFTHYLGSQFTEGMTWQNWGQYDPDVKRWQVDHIFALSLFDVRDLRQVLRASHWTNLQPMWADQNYDKWNHLPAGLTALQTLQFAYSDLGGNLAHLQTKPVPGVPGVVLPVHDAYTQLRIAYAYVDRKKVYRKESDSEVIHVKSTESDKSDKSDKSDESGKIK